MTTPANAPRYLRNSLNPPYRTVIKAKADAFRERLLWDATRWQIAAKGDAP